MCNPEGFPLESVAASVLENAQANVSLPGKTDEQARHMQPHLPPDEPIDEPSAECVSYAGDIPPEVTVGTSAQVPTNSKESPNSSILAEADKIAGENRSRDYGHPLANHRRIAAMWNVQLEKKLAQPLTAKDVAVLMIGLKLARLITSPNHHDSFVDIAGYVKCWDMMDQVGGE